ncbi:hypothetical protein KR074_000638 [Drosophila pseudoananassae]|nr:hypothetical protein KR074_000638 [Drosophila pseudoananassae]
MSKTNGWNGCGAGTHGNGSSTSLQSSPKYLRTTELRRVEDNDIYRLSKILDENACWRKLMSIIPKGLDVQASSPAGGLNFPNAIKKGFKYTTQDAVQIDEAANRLAADQSKSQMMIDEWKTSGKLQERPTVGVLLQLLVQAELFSAADFVALDFLNEPKPDRPSDGPAAPISLDLSELLDENMDVDGDGPNPSPANQAALGSIGLNLDNFDKHIMSRNKSLPQPSETVPPIAPPRTSRLHRDATSSNIATESTATGSTSATTPNIPNLTILNRTEQLAEQENPPRPQNLPNLSILIASSTSSITTNSTSLGPTNSQDSLVGTSNIPKITLLIENSAQIRPPATEAAETSLNNLPMISALNLNTNNGESPPPNSSSSSSLSNDEDECDADDADASLQNLSTSEQQNSNNDSSLTTVTGTSGDNSFEMTNDSSSTSNDEYGGNIPNLSELHP